MLASLFAASTTIWAFEPAPGALLLEEPALLATEVELEELALACAAALFDATLLLAAVPPLELSVVPPQAASPTHDSASTGNILCR